MVITLVCDPFIEKNIIYFRHFDFIYYYYYRVNEAFETKVIKNLQITRRYITCLYMREQYACVCVLEQKLLTK